MIKLMAMELTNMPMELLMSESGSRTSNMVQALKNGQMVPSTRVNIKMARSMEMVA